MDAKGAVGAAIFNRLAELVVNVDFSVPLSFSMSRPSASLTRPSETPTGQSQSIPMTTVRIAGENCCLRVESCLLRPTYNNLEFNQRTHLSSLGQRHRKIHF